MNLYFYRARTDNGRELIASDDAHLRWRVDARFMLRQGANAIGVSFAAPISVLRPMALAQTNLLPGARVRRRAQWSSDFPYVRKPKCHCGLGEGARSAAIRLGKGADGARVQDRP
ncbi:glycosyl hydrolase 2 galactose-binding domain-containing protein [Sphingomonas sp. 1P08PE]|uniref:glycosyl hydrolase 2 galactose-binding domain-containing protein n=1 Tax=Sphingomonas sp. 1P08PE TaxID=554122 RepID=UPI0039A12A52